MIDIPSYLKNNPKQAAMTLVLLSLIVSLLYLNFLLKPQIMRVAAVFARMRQTSTDLEKAEEEIERIPRYKVDMAAYEEKIASYEKMLPAEQEIPVLLESLSDMARDSNVKIIAITPVKEEKMPDGGRPAGGGGMVYREMPILINARSGYHELGSFLAKLEYAGRFMKVADIMIRSNSAVPKKQDVALMILTYISLKNNR